MGSPTYIPLATVTLGGSDNEIIFSSIPAIYRDLVIVIAGSATGATSPSIRFNNDAGSNYNNNRMFANPSTFNSQSFTDTYGSVGFMNTDQSNVRIQILDYSTTDKHKIAIGRNANVDTVRLEATRWANTAAIHTVSVRMDGAQNYNTGTVMSLYGIAG